MSNKNLTIGFIRPDGVSTVRPFVANETNAADHHPAQARAIQPETPRVGVEYHVGKSKPYRAYRLVDGVKSYKGDYAKESDAWAVLTRQATAE